MKKVVSEQQVESLRVFRNASEWRKRKTFLFFVGNTIYRLAFLMIFLIGNVTYSQKCLILSECRQNQSYKDIDSMRIYSFDDSGIKLITHARFQEYFVESDTLFRDYIQLSGQKIILDPLLGISGAYTAEYDLIGFYEIKRKGKTYLIFEGGDTFPMGSEATVCYIIFGKEENKLNFISTYEHDQDPNHPFGNIKICFSKKGLKLKEKYLIKIK